MADIVSPVAVSLRPELLQQGRGLIPQLLTLDQSLPVAGTQQGSIFADRFDSTLSWYLPAYALIDPDAAFAFAATQATVPDASGNPFNQATLTLDLRQVDPPDVVQRRAADPAAKLQPIVAESLAATLAVPYTDASGTTQTTGVPAQVQPQGDGTLRVVVAGLLGPTVIQAYLGLTQSEGVSLQLQMTYQVWRHGTPPRWQLPPQLLLNILSTTPNAAMLPVGRPPLGDPVIPMRPPAPAPPPTDDTWTLGSDSAGIGVALGSTFATDAYRPSYTLTADGATHPIIDVHDLQQFDEVRSEYRELTSLGDVGARYPSLQRLYLGQFSGTVVAVPASYGIVCGAVGCAARLDAAVDPSATSASHSRFRFSFELAPAVDPVDLAQLAVDLAGIPEARGRSLHLQLPNGLDTRVTPTLAGFDSVSYATGTENHTLLLSVDIGDAAGVPAITATNLFLGELTGPGTPALFGQIGVRLDDIYTPPVTAGVVLSLRKTAASDDVAISVGGTPPAVTATNQAPFALHLGHAAGQDAGGFAVTPFDQVIDPAASVALPLRDPTTTTSAVVQRSLSLPPSFPAGSLAQYVDIHTETIQEVQHALIVNATAIDFATAGLGELDVAISIDALPSLTVPSIVLTPSHRYDSATVQIPVGTVITGLAATLTISVIATDTAQNRQVEVHNDFLASPVCILQVSSLQ